MRQNIVCQTSKSFEHTGKLWRQICSTSLSIMDRKRTNVDFEIFIDNFINDAPFLFFQQQLEKSVGKHAASQTQRTRSKAGRFLRRK